MPKMTVQWFFDISTQADVMQRIRVFAGGQDLVRRLNPQFCAYKYFKLGRVSLKLVPASTLPVDPTGLSYEAGETTVDPRDQLTPAMARITNGESVAPLPSGLSADELHSFYNNMILDRRWFKWSLQSGVKKSAIPLFWNVGSPRQYPFPANETNIIGKEIDSQGNDVYYTACEGRAFVSDDPEHKPTFASYGGDTSSDYSLVQTGHTVRLGWLPTDVLVPDFANVPSIADCPAVECFQLILPPAYKTRYYYRCYVTETVFFKEPITNYFAGFGNKTSIDRFIRPNGVIQAMPESNIGGSTQPTFVLSSDHNHAIDNNHQGDLNEGDD